MVEHLMQLLARCLEIAEIDHEAGYRIRHSTDRNFGAKRVPVQITVFMADRFIHELVRGIEPELVGNFSHDIFSGNCSGNTQQLVGLQTQTPLGMLQTVPERTLRVGITGLGIRLQAIHRLQQEMIEGEVFKTFGKG